MLVQVPLLFSGWQSLSPLAEGNRQVEHDDQPVSEVEPLTHCRQLLALVRPLPELNLPAGHAEQCVAPLVLEYWPATQTRQLS